MKSRVW